MASQPVGTGLKLVMGFVRSLFPLVPRITTDQLEIMMANKNVSRRLVILDTREPEEIQVSRLPNSIPVNPSLKDMSELLSVINKAKGQMTDPNRMILQSSTKQKVVLKNKQPL